MGENEASVSAAGKRPARRRTGEIVFVLVIVLAIVAAAFFQEEIHYFLQLQAWNPGRPGQTVVQFLRAGREGKQDETDRCVDVNLFHPLREGSRFVGYQMATTIGNLEYRFRELAGPGEIHATHGELVFKGEGAAMVTVPDATGRPVDYRLAMQHGSWKITEIRGGRARR
jgi:hypothetical protein